MRTDGEDLLDLVTLVRMRADDDHTVEKVKREAVRGAVAGAADARVAPVACHDDDGRELILKRAVDVGKAFNVEHMDLVDEEHSRDDFRLTFLFPLAHFGVDLVAHLAANLARVAGE